jgi:hypothetical protein
MDVVFRDVCIGRQLIVRDDRISRQLGSRAKCPRLELERVWFIPCRKLTSYGYDMTYLALSKHGRQLGPVQIDHNGAVA